MSDRKFAVGEDRFIVDGETFECPATVAGYKTGDCEPVIAIAELWDEHVRAAADSEMPKVVAEPLARRQWLEVLQLAENRWGEDSLHVEYGRKVARELGWLDGS